jgi:hypothetical protein
VVLPEHPPLRVKYRPELDLRLDELASFNPLSDVVMTGVRMVRPGLRLQRRTIAA